MGGDNYVNTLLTISTPHQGCRLASQLRDEMLLKNHQLIVEPGIRALGVHYDLFVEEYNERNIREMNKSLLDSENVNYISVGARKLQVKCSESLRITNEVISDCTTEDYPNDGIVATKESIWGTHLMNFDADHFEIIGMRPEHSAKAMFEFYSNAIKYYDPSYKKHVDI
jgi:hypothetical protein